MLSPATLFAMLANAVMPAYTVFKHVQLALDPGAFDEEFASSLVVLFLAQIPVALLMTVFAGVSTIEGPAWRRVFIYVVVVAIIAAVGGFWRLAFDNEFGPILAWALGMQLVTLMFAGAQPDLAQARIQAVADDIATMFVLTIFGGLIAIIGAVALVPYVNRVLEWRTITLEWSDVAWIGAFYFALRAWSGVYVYAAAFGVRRKGFFQRPWIDRIARLGRPAKE